MGEYTDLENLDLLISHFRDGCKLNFVQKLGLEEEHFVIRDATGHAVTYYEEDGVESILRELSTDFPVLEEKEGHLLGCSNNDFAISLEPAAQLEISVAPRESIHCIMEIYRSFRRNLDELLARRGMHLEAVGYQPKDCVDDLPLIPKRRYEYMDRYFQLVDTRGRNMMRGTASTQVSIDYQSESDFIRKIRCAYLIMPAIRLLTDNAAVFEGKPASEGLVRTRIWEHVDPDRCGIIPHLFDESFGFESYAQYLWHLPLIFRPTPEGSVYTGRARVCDLWADTLMTKEDALHVLSMVFPDVRLKHYVELRGADAMPAKYIAAFLALIKGIFFHNSAISAILEEYDFVREDTLRETDRDLMRSGYDARIYGSPADHFIRNLFLLARHGLDDSERGLLEPFEELVQEKTTLAQLSRANMRIGSK
jgi:glutamate--cysteine ligase